MSQVKIYGTQSRLPSRRDALSDVIHGCVVEALEYPTDKRAHRFFPLAPEDFRYPPGRSDDYTIIEISLFEGRSVVANKKLYALLFERCETQIGIAPVDLEITLTETPRHNWGIRAHPATNSASTTRSRSDARREAPRLSNTTARRCCSSHTDAHR